MRLENGMFAGTASYSGKSSYSGIGGGSSYWGNSGGGPGSGESVATGNDIGGAGWLIGATGAVLGCNGGGGMLGVGVLSSSLVLENSKGSYWLLGLTGGILGGVGLYMGKGFGGRSGTGWCAGWRCGGRMSGLEGTNGDGLD